MRVKRSSKYIDSAWLGFREFGELSHGFVFTNVKTARRGLFWKENLFSMVRDYSVGEKNHIDWRFVRFWRGKSFGWRVNFSIVDKKGWASESLGKLSHGFVFTNVKTARRVWLWKENLFSMVRDYSVGEKNHIDWRFVRFWRGKSFGWRVNFSIVDKKGWTSECWGNCHTDSFLLT